MLTLNLSNPTLTIHTPIWCTTAGLVIRLYTYNYTVCTYVYTVQAGRLFTAKTSLLSMREDLMNVFGIKWISNDSACLVYVWVRH